MSPHPALHPVPVRRALLAMLALAALAIGAWWYLRGVPVRVPDAPQARVQCISYAPYRLQGETPFDETWRVTRARIEDDLKIIATRAACVRTYSVDQGLDQVPAVAAELGLQVYLGAWLGRDRARNEAELARAIAVARGSPATVRALIVGNEVLLRRELPEDELVRLLTRARAALSPIAVTYADVWEFWLAHPSLAPAVDFATIHVLPYWEDHPVALPAAMDHVEGVLARMRTALGGKPILIGETGWPSAGRARGEAQPGRVEQASYLRRFAAMAAREGLRYNLIEAFDQPWKRRLEGAMGGYWGLFDSAGREKFPWTGPVADDPGWARGWRGGAVGAAVFAIVGLPFVLRRPRGLEKLAVLALSGWSLGALSFAQADYLVHWNRDPLEWLATGVFALVGLAHALCAVAALVRDDLQWPGIAALRRPGASRLARLGGALRGLCLFGAATIALLLLVDPRYRGFPWPLHVSAAMAGIAMMLAGQRRPADAREESVLAAVVLVAGAGVVLQEGLWNRDALAFVVLLCAVAGPVSGWRYGWDLIAGGRTAATSASSTPTAAGSKQ